ncbi:unnamed protein product [Cunninghamella blakesleeana]
MYFSTVQYSSNCPTIQHKSQRSALDEWIFVSILLVFERSAQGAQVAQGVQGAQGIRGAQGVQDIQDVQLSSR